MTDQERAKAAVEWMDNYTNGIKTDGVISGEAIKHVRTLVDILRPIAAGTSVIVPIEPTNEMCEAFHVAHEEFEDGDLDVESPTHEWMAMVEASQEGE